MRIVRQTHHNSAQIIIKNDNIFSSISPSISISAHQHSEVWSEDEGKWRVLRSTSHIIMEQPQRMDVTHRREFEGKKGEISVGLSTINYNLRESSLFCKWAHLCFTYTAFPRQFCSSSAFTFVRARFYHPSQQQYTAEIWGIFLHLFGLICAGRPRWWVQWVIKNLLCGSRFFFSVELAIASLN